MVSVGGGGIRRSRRLGPLQASGPQVRRAGRTPALPSGPLGGACLGARLRGLHPLVLSSRETPEAPEMNGRRRPAGPKG